MATKKKATRSTATKKSGGSGKADLVEKPREASSRRVKAFIKSQAYRKAHAAARSTGTSLKAAEALKQAMMPKDSRVARVMEYQARREDRKVARKALEEKKAEALRQAIFPTRVR